MGDLRPESDPFVAIGLTDGFSNVVVNAIKRGRNGEGYGFKVHHASHLETSIQPQDGRIIGEVVDKIAGDNAAATVAVLVHDILIRNGEA